VKAVQQRRAGIFIPCMLIIIQSVIYALGDPITKLVYRVMPVYSVLTVRYALGVLVMFLVAGKRIVRGLREASWRDLAPTSICIAMAYLTANAAMSLTDLTAVAFIRSLNTVMTPLLALAIFRTPYRKHNIPIQLAVVVGLYLLCGLGGLTGFGAGELCALVSALMMASSLVFSRSAVSKGVDPIALSAVQAGASALAALGAAFVVEGGLHYENATPAIWLVIVYLAAVATVGGYWLQNFALRKISARTVALLQCTYPVLAAVMAHFVLSERLTAAGVAGCVIILGCVVAETILRDK